MEYVMLSSSVFAHCSCMTISYLILTFISITSSAQNIANKTIEVGNIKAIVNADGRLFETDSSHVFYAPKSGTDQSIYAANLWIGGLDQGAQIHMAAQTYRQTGTDFWPGPLDTVNASIDSTTMSLYNRIWGISKETVDSFKAGFGISQEILEWPGNGDISKGISAQMAPYIDVDGNGIYDPYAGDYPDVRGDKMLWFVYNDAYDIHGESGGEKLGVEIRASIYGYDCPDDSDSYNSLFVHYDIFNRSSYQLNDVYLGTWTDIDLGYYLDDYIGSMVDLNSIYGYNADNFDGDFQIGIIGYGDSVPAQSVTLLQGPLADANDGKDNNHNGTTDELGETFGLSNFMYYDNDATTTGNPDTLWDYYNYMKSIWKDGTHLTYGANGYGGNVNCDFMFPANSDSLGFGTGGVPQADWSEVSAGNTEGDRRGLGGIGPFTFSPSDKLTLDLAYIFALDAQYPNNSLSVDLLRNRIKNVSQRFKIGDLYACSHINTAGIKETELKLLQFSPNPAKDYIRIQLPVANEKYKIYLKDMLGREILSANSNTQGECILDVSMITKGYYYITADGNEIYSNTIVIER